MSSLRITGMATGLDTDTLIKQMMKPYTAKVDKMKQDRQILAWRQDLYRNVVSDVSTISKTYFDVLKSDTYMLSKNNYAGFDITATNNVSGQNAGVSATASVGAVTGSYIVQVEQLASTAKVNGGAINESNNPFDVAKWKGKSITFNIGGTEENIKIDISNEVTDQPSLIADLNSKLLGKINVSQGTGGGIKFNALTNNSIKVVSTDVIDDMSDLTGKIINPNRYTTKLSELGIVDGGVLKFEYKDSNGTTENKSITVSKDSTISQLIEQINQATSGAVKLNFSELTGNFNVESLQTGSLATLNVTEDGAKGILGKLRLNVPVDGVRGVDSKVIITPPGAGAVATTVEKSGNIFSIDGINYSLTKAGTTNNIIVAGNSQKTYDKIKGFIDKYNDLVSTVSQKTGEKKQYSYLPLTDEAKEAMSEDEIKKWEDKAKVGLLKGDSNLENMLLAMRSAFYQSVEGSGISLSEIGLSTSPDTTQRGKIIIDEAKLKTAIETRGEQVSNLFTKSSTTHPSYNPDYTSSERSTRNKEEGIFQRINDIILDYTRTTRNSDGKKGILLEKAGIKGDVTELNSLLSKDIIKKDAVINEMIKNLSTREEKYYLQFSKLETAMNKLNSQSSWLTQQLGG